MITLSQAVMDKINNPMQLPSNQGDPYCILWVQKTDGGAVYSKFSDYIKSGTVSSKYDDYSYNMSLTLIKADEILDYNSHFTPGAKVTLWASFGYNVASGINIPLFSGHVDECSWDEDGEEFTISATSNINHLLKESTMGDTHELSGLSHEVGEAIMQIADVQTYYITEGTYEWTYTFKSSDTCLSALEQMYPIFPKDGYDQPGFGILESPAGYVVFGYWRDRMDETKHGVPVGNYIFNAGSECFAISTRMCGDKCYSKVYANGKAADGVDLEEVKVNVTNIVGWDIPTNKIYHATFNGYTMQEMLQDWAETIALELQYQGITRDFTGPFRPQLTVGDIATIQFDNNVQQGVITSITHHVGMDGFSTDFTVDSGGTYSAVSGWSSSMKANGYNRRQNMADTIHEMAEIVTEKALNEYDPVSIQDMWDAEQEEEKDLEAHRNEMLIAFDGRQHQELVIATGGNPDPQANAGE